jgi:hypothetical protein
MQKEMQAEVMLCPNCNEEVPKTLYCLNCGYPLYKEEQEIEKEQKEDLLIDMATKDLEEKTSANPVTEILGDDMLESGEKVPTNPDDEFVGYVDTVPIIENANDNMILDEKSLDEQSNTAEQKMDEFVSIDSEEQVIADGSKAEELKDVMADRTEDVVHKSLTEFQPDPAIKEVMSKLAKNISLKIRLVDHFLNGNVKEEVFNRLFERYLAWGERLMNSRNEIVERLQFNLDSMESSLNEAKIGLEEMEIKKSIGDVSEEEYRAKLPAFRWDIEQYEDEVSRRNKEITYLCDLSAVMPPDDIKELKMRAVACHEEIDRMVEIGNIGADTAASIKISLKDASACLEQTG